MGSGMPAGREGWPLSRTWPSILAGLVCLGLALLLAFQSGGYFPDDYLLAGAIAFAVLSALLVARPPHYRLSAHAVVAIGALAALAAWIGLSAQWSLSPDIALEDMNRALTYVAVFGLALVAAGSGRLSRHLIWGTLGVLTLVSAAALISRLYPDVIATQPAEFGGYRLSYPLGYWNALGAYSALGATLALGLAGNPRSPWWMRAGAAGASVLLATTMYFSLSRGAWLSLAVGLIVLVLLSAHRWSLLISSTIVAAAAAVVLIRLQAYPGLVDGPTAGAGQLSEGHAFGPFLALVVLAAGAAQALVGRATARASAVVMESVRAHGTAIASAVLAIALAAVLVGYALVGGKAEGKGATRLDRIEDFVSRQWDEFMMPAAVTPRASAPRGAERLGSARGSRSELYRVALNGFSARPVQGEGAGSFQYRWIREREQREFVRDAHSLYLETLDELGVVGALLLTLFLGSVVLAAARSRMRPVAMGRSEVAAVCAAISVWLVHAGFDWDWEMPALTLIFLILAASLFPYGRRRRAADEGVAEEDLKLRAGYSPGVSKPT
jgi:O-Antigen ligase